MATLGKREIGLIEDALKDIYEQLTGDAIAFRRSLLSNLIQGDNGSNYVTHSNALFDAFRKIEPRFEDLPLEKAVDFVKTSYDVLVETDQIANINIPEMMWTGYDETANALEDIAIALNEKYDFDIDTTNIDNILVDMSEQLMGSDLKVGDIPEALEIQIRILDEMQYHEIAQMYTAWTSTEDMRPMTIQLVELYDQVDNLPDNVVTSLYTDFEDNLWITDEPNQYLLDYDNPEKLDTKSVKNMIKYYFEQVGRLQEGYINFNGAEHAFLDGFNISNQLDTPLVLRDNLKLVIKDNLDVLLPNSKDPYQLLHSTTSFEGVSGMDIPFQLSREYFTRYQDIIGTTISDNISDADYARAEFGVNQNMSVGEFAYEFELAEISDLDKALDKPVNLESFTEIFNKRLKEKYPFYIQELNFELKDGRLHITDMSIREKLRGQGVGSQIFNEILQFANNNNLDISLSNDGDFNTPFWENRGFTPDDKLGLQILETNKTTQADATVTNVVDEVTPTQALDELDEAISKSDGVDNLNKAKKIINNNPGVFRKIFSVLEKLDIGDQVITKGVLPALGRIGLGAATGPLGIAYAGYEMALLLSDIGNAAYTAQTTDESFWDNFGEVSDKYSIAYKISKPVYDIILDNLNNDLTEKEDEEILFSFNR